MTSEGIRPPASIYDRHPELREPAREGRLPNHLFIIPDGNGRWAEVNGLRIPTLATSPILRFAARNEQFASLIKGLDLLKKTGLTHPLMGHLQGVEKFTSTVRDVRELPIKYFGGWGFASGDPEKPEEPEKKSGNWTREPTHGLDEVSGLFLVVSYLINSNIQEINQTNGVFRVIGRRDRIPNYLVEDIGKAEELTKANDGQTVYLGLDYGGIDQELREDQELVRRVLSGEITDPSQVTLDFRNKLLDGAGLIPPMDLIIRTSGEQRVSDLGTLSSNAEFYSEPKLFPDLETEDIVRALINYTNRDRRFGGRSSASK